MKKIIPAIVALLSVGAAQPAARAEEVPQDTVAKVVDIGEDVVITTPKENSRLRRQPLAATSLSQGDLRENAVQSVKDLSALVPNLFIPDYGSKLTTSVYVRGIGSRINTPAVGLYVDNIPFIDKSAFDFSYSDIERIHVMRGPQGTLYGRNTMGGLISIFTKSPFTYRGTDLTLSAATYNDWKASVSHYHRISPQFAFSSNFFYGHKGGFFRNDGRGGERVDKGDDFGGRLRAILLPGRGLKLDFTLNYEYSRRGGYPYEYTGVTGGAEEDRPDAIGRIDYNHRSGYKRNLLNGGLNLECQAGNLVLSSVTGFQLLDDHMDLDQDFTAQDIYTMMQKQNSKTLSEELVLKSKPGRRWQWTTGASTFCQWLHTEAPVTFRTDGMAWLNSTVNENANRYLPSVSQGPMTMQFVFGDVIEGSTLPIGGTFCTPVLNAALFHQSTFNALFGTEGLSLTLGLRMDYERLKLDYDTGCAYSHTYSLAGKLMPGDRTIPMVPETRFEQSLGYCGNLSHDYIQLLPKAALQYDFDPRNNIYACISRGYRSGGYNIQMFSDLLQADMRSANMGDVASVTVPVVESAGMIDEATRRQIVGVLEGMAQKAETDVRQATLYRPEYSWNYEAGAHLTLVEGRLLADFAAFYMDTRDQQISRFADSGLGRITVNAGKSRSLGAEVSLRVRPTDGLTLDGSYGYTYATFTDYVVSDETDYSGRYVPFVPKHTFNIGARYVIGLKKRALADNITLHVRYKAAGRIYWTEENDASQALYGTLDGRLSLGKGNGEVALWVNNALDTRYQAFWFETMGRGFAQAGRPVQVGIDLRCRF